MANTTHRDPVCGMQVDQNKTAGSSTHEGKEYYLCSTACKAKFDKNPSEYLKAGR